MSRLDFTRDEFAARRQAVQSAMAGAGIDWLLLFHPVSIHWLTGSDAKSYQSFQCLLVSATSDRLAIFTRESERNEFEADALVDEVLTWGGSIPEDPVAVFQRVAEGKGLRAKRVGMEIPAYYLHPLHHERLKAWFGPALCHDSTSLVGDLKMVKSAAEIAYIREAARIADIAMVRLQESLAIGQSELEAAGVVYGSLLGSGSGLAASTMNVVSGERSAFSHGAPTHRRFAAGDSVNVEYGATFKRYTSTIGRQFCIGEPSARLREVYATVRQAADACIAAIRDGVPAVVPHEAAAKVIADAGLDRYRVHTSGYGLAPGFPPSWGEAVGLFGGNPYTLRAGMVVSVEPPVFIGPEKLGVRIIDNVLVTDKGCELLSTVDRGLVCV